MVDQTIPWNRSANRRQSSGNFWNWAKKTNEDSLRDNIKHTNIHIIRGSQEERKRGRGHVWRYNYIPNLGESTDIQIHKGQRIPSRSTQRGSCQDKLHVKWHVNKC